MLLRIVGLFNFRPETVASLQLLAETLLDSESPLMARRKTLLLVFTIPFVVALVVMARSK
jgi:hypothetical protein